MNRILPEQGKNNFFSEYIASQESYLKEIEESFAPLPIMKVQHKGREVFGLKLLDSIGDAIYLDDDPTTIYYDESPMVITENSAGFEIRLRIPFIGENDFKLNKYGDELVVDLGSRRRNLFLPRFANFLELESFKYNEPWLVVELIKK